MVARHCGSRHFNKLTLITRFLLLIFSKIHIGLKDCVWEFTLVLANRQTDSCCSALQFTQEFLRLTVSVTATVVSHSHRSRNTGSCFQSKSAGKLTAHCTCSAPNSRQTATKWWTFVGLFPSEVGATQTQSERRIKNCIYTQNDWTNADFAPCLQRCHMPPRHSNSKAITQFLDRIKTHDLISLLHHNKTKGDIWLPHLSPSSLSLYSTFCSW